MIGYLEGEVKTPGVIVANGIGWSIVSPDELVVGTSTQIHVTTVMRDSQITLYGFVDPVDQDLFDALTKVSRVGPSMAIAILAALTPGQLAQIIADRNASALAKVPGIGKKTAEVICTFLSLPSGVLAENTAPSPDEEVVATLVSLGFNSHNATAALDQARRLIGPDLDEATLLRQAMSILRTNS